MIQQVQEGAIETEPFVRDLLAPVLLNQVLHDFVLALPLALLTQEAVQLSSQVGDVIFTERLEVFLHCGNRLLLQQFPFGAQHLVLLFQEANL